jgi:hypothetical protein
MTIAEVESLTLSHEIALAVAEDAFNAKRARLESGFAAERGWKLPLKKHQFREMNGTIDLLMLESTESRRMSEARRALQAHNWKVCRMRHGYQA